MADMRVPLFEAVVPILPVRDLAGAIAYYDNVLGFRLAWQWGDPPTIASVCRDRVEINLSADAAVAPGGIGRAYVQMTGVDAYYAQITQAGANIAIPLAERAYGMKDCRVLDPSGNELSFGEAMRG